MKSIIKNNEKISLINTSNPLRSYSILFIAFFEGFSVMCVELLGAKILNSYFGSMLVVWTIILTITLVSLALGYFIGGKLSQINQQIKLSRNLYLCAFFICFNLIISNYLFLLLSTSDFYVGLIMSSLVILTPPLMCLGIVSPILIQLYNKNINTSGYSAGKIYAVSTLGGVFSAFLLGFFIIENFGITYPLIITALCLFLISIYVNKKQKLTVLIQMILLVFMILISIKKIGEKKSSLLKIVYESEGIQGQLKVIDYFPPGQQFSTRRLLINGMPQTNIINTPEAYSFWPYTHILNAFSSIKDNNASTLLLGLGGGSVSRELQRRNVKFDVVELDKRIIELAPKFFYFQVKGMNIIHDEARHYIKKTNKKYDVVIYDVLSGSVRSNYLFTKESLEELKNKLTSDAIVIVNYQGIVEGAKDLAFQALYKTFQHADFNVYYWAADPKIFSDIVFVLSMKKVDFSVINKANLNVCCQTNPLMIEFFKSPVSNKSHDFMSIAVLEDDKPRMEMLSREVVYDWRKTMINDVIVQELEAGVNLYK